MLFSAKFSKFGRGENLTAIMPSNNIIDIYYFEDGINKKTVTIENENLSLKKIKLNLGYRELVPIKDNFFLSRISSSISVIKYE